MWYFALFLNLSIFQSPTWKECISLAGSGEMLRGYLTLMAARLLPEVLLFVEKFIWLLTSSLHLIYTPTERLRCSHRIRCAALWMSCARHFSFVFWILNTFSPVWAHWFHQTAFDSVHWRCVFKMMCNNVDSEPAPTLWPTEEFTHNINFRILH